jgi:hypothetical protein
LTELAHTPNVTVMNKWIAKGHISGTTEVEVIDGVLVPQALRITATNEEIPLEVEINAEVVDGRMVARTITCTATGGAKLSTELLRQVPVANLVRAGTFSGPGFMSLVGTDIEALKATGPTDETLKVVAKLYRLAYVIGDPPTASVRTSFDVSKSTAARWVQLARHRGFLGPASPRAAAIGDGDKLRVSQAPRKKARSKRSAS